MWMERVDKTVFFNNLDAKQLVQFREKEFQIFKDVVLPVIIIEPKTCIYTHFITLKGSLKGTPIIYMSAEVTYDNHGACVTRTIGTIKTYTNQVERDFYMALLEYDNTLEPNPVLFNARGTAEDAAATFLNTYVVAYHCVFEPYLN
jgi:hypothetical protein